MKKFGIFLAILFLTVSIFPQSFDLIPNKSPDETRILKILIVADQGYREQIPDWQEEITEIITGASKALDIQTGIKLEIAGFKDWQRDTKGYQESKELFTELFFQDFPRTNQADFDIVIGLTSHYLENFLGIALIYSSYIIISNKTRRFNLDKNEDVESMSYPLRSPLVRKKLVPSVILHEIGHIFDCDDTVDIKDEKYIMYAWAIGSLTYSKESIKTIKENKWRKFPIVPDKKE